MTSTRWWRLVAGTAAGLLVVLALLVTALRIAIAYVPQNEQKLRTWIERQTQMQFEYSRLDARLRWRAAQKLTILELRVWKLDSPICIPNEGHLWGCFSWVDVSAAPGWDTPGALALDDDAFAAKQAALREALQVVEVLEGF